MSFTENQSITEEQKTIARNNIGAVSLTSYNSISSQLTTTTSTIATLSTTLTTTANTVASLSSSIGNSNTTLTTLSTNLTNSYAEMSTNVGILSTIIGSPINVKDVYLIARGLLQPQ